MSFYRQDQKQQGKILFLKPLLVINPFTLVWHTAHRSKVPLKLNPLRFLVLVLSPCCCLGPAPRTTAAII